MAYTQPPKRTGLPREVLKWLQSLDLSLSLKNTRRDFSNGYLVAEIFSWYYPDDFPMHSYDNGTSLPTKLGNWSQIEKFLLKQNLRLPKEVIDGTIHCKPGAAELLIPEIYSLLTNRRVKGLQDGEVDFTDRNYQEKLPMVARATASLAIKNNLRLSEVIAQPSVDVNKQKVQAIIHMHVQRRQAERAENPSRFNVRPTLGELAARLPPSSQEWHDVSSVTSPSESSGSARMSPPASRSKAIVQFKEINVRQTDKPSVLFNNDMSSQIKGF